MMKVLNLDDVNFTEEIVSMLDTLYPHRCPKPSQNDRDIWMYAGKRELIDNILASYERTKKHNLNNVNKIGGL